MIEFHDPRAEPGASIDPYTLGLDPGGAKVTIGLIANGFPDSASFLEELERSLGAHLPSASFRHWNKRNASSTLSDEMADEIVDACDGVIGAYGH